MIRKVGAVWLYGEPPFSLRYALTKKQLIDGYGVDVELISFLNYEDDSPNLQWIYEIERGKVYPAHLYFDGRVSPSSLKKVELLRTSDENLTLIRSEFNSEPVEIIFEDDLSEIEI